MEKQREAVARQACDFAFNEWLRALPDPEKETILLPKIEKARKKKDLVLVHMLQRTQKHN